MNSTPSNIQTMLTKNKRMFTILVWGMAVYLCVSAIVELAVFILWKTDVIHLDGVDQMLNEDAYLSLFVNASMIVQPLLKFWGGVLLLRNSRIAVLVLGTWLLSDLAIGGYALYANPDYVTSDLFEQCAASIAAFGICMLQRAGLCQRE